MPALSSTPGEHDTHARERDRVLALLQLYGAEATSFQTLEPACRYFFDGDDAVVAYFDTGSAWVTAGAPIAHATRAFEVALRFQDAARARRKRVVFFGAENIVFGGSAFRAIKIGEQPSWNPQTFAQNAQNSRTLRQQLRRARNKDIAISRLNLGDISQSSAAVEKEMRELFTRWLRTRSMARMGFLVDFHPLLFAQEKRYWGATRQGKLIAFLAAAPIYQRGGWLFEDLVRDPDAPNGTIELLVHEAMRDLGEEGFDYATLGMAPLSGIDGIFRHVRKHFAFLYDFHGLEAFKRKLLPSGSAPIFMLIPIDAWEPRAFADALTAFAHGSILAFGKNTLQLWTELNRRRAKPTLVSR